MMGGGYDKEAATLMILAGLGLTLGLFKLGEILVWIWQHVSISIG